MALTKYETPKFATVREMEYLIEIQFQGCTCTQNETVSTHQDEIDITEQGTYLPSAARGDRKDLDCLSLSLAFLSNSIVQQGSISYLISSISLLTVFVF